MFEAQQDLDFSQSALAVGLVLEGADLLDGHAHLVLPVVGGAGTQTDPKVEGTRDGDLTHWK